ncbi:MAG: TraR/DksA C4-type zinc finger protein [Pseudomonadota bacterium]
MSSFVSIQAVSQRLDQRAKELEVEIAAAQARAGLDLSEVTDREDEASRRANARAAGGEWERDLAELHEIAQAQKRLADGRYGQCADCGADIGEKRLWAQPSAIRCTPCQTVFERSARTPHTAA